MLFGCALRGCFTELFYGFSPPGNPGGLFFTFDHFKKTLSLRPHGEIAQVVRAHDS